MFFVHTQFASYGSLKRIQAVRQGFPGLVGDWLSFTRRFLLGAVRSSALSRGPLEGARSVTRRSDVPSALLLALVLQEIL